ncbi:TPA: hypothetical protein HA265_01755 [Candidatus Woesearchaeota archaeon]|nr:hypothetical protein [Candidatus Woesearchaeota archaeon]
MDDKYGTKGYEDKFVRRDDLKVHYDFEKSLDDRIVDENIRRLLHPTGFNGVKALVEVTQDRPLKAHYEVSFDPILGTIDPDYRRAGYSRLTLDERMAVVSVRRFGKQESPMFGAMPGDNLVALALAYIKAAKDAKEKLRAGQSVDQKDYDISMKVYMLQLEAIGKKPYRT